MRRRAAEPAATPERLWTIQQVSEFLAVPVGTLYQWHYYRKGPQPYKVGKHLRYDPRSVMRWLEGSAD